MGWVANFINSAISMQSKVLFQFPESERAKGYGYAAKFIVEGPEGGVFYLWFSDKGIGYKPDNIPVRNELYCNEDTLLDIITPKITAEELVDLIKKEGTKEKAIPRLRPRLEIRSAFAHGDIWMPGNNPDIDTEMWSQIWEKFVYGIAFPLVIENMLRKRVRK
jgi:hypothetical protein